MNRHVFLLMLIVAAISALAFSLGPPGYVPLPQRPDPPVISLTNAYRIAIDAIGRATNQFQCVRTNGNLSWANEGDWVFVFSSTNGHTKAVCVLRKFVRDQGDTNEVWTTVFDDLQNE
jgi:hypothetical protein